MNKGMKIALIVVGLIVVSAVTYYVIKKRKVKAQIAQAKKLGLADKAVASKEIAPPAKG